RGEFEAVPGAAGWRFGFHRLRSHSVLPIATCDIHDLRIEQALPAFAQAANELHVTDLQNLLLTAEPNGRGLLWRLRFKGREPKWPREDFAHRVAGLLPEQVLLDDAMSLEFWGLTFRVQSDTFVQTNYKQMVVLYETALAMLGDVAGGGGAWALSGRGHRGARSGPLRRRRHRRGRDRTQVRRRDGGGGDPTSRAAGPPERANQL